MHKTLSPFPNKTCVHLQSALTGQNPMPNRRPSFSAAKSFPFGSAGCSNTKHAPTVSDARVASTPGPFELARPLAVPEHFRPARTKRFPSAPVPAHVCILFSNPIQPRSFPLLPAPAPSNNGKERAGAIRRKRRNSATLPSSNRAHSRLLTRKSPHWYTPSPSVSARYRAEM